MHDRPKKDDLVTGGKITIADVARLAGVSKAVASRALSPEPRPVSADKRERVLAAARDLIRAAWHALRRRGGRPPRRRRLWGTRSRGDTCGTRL